jgi:hypothetical protein
VKLNRVIIACALLLTGCAGTLSLGATIAGDREQLYVVASSELSCPPGQLEYIVRDNDVRGPTLVTVRGCNHYQTYVRSTGSHDWYRDSARRRWNDDNRSWNRDWNWDRSRDGNRGRDYDRRRGQDYDRDRNSGRNYDRDRDNSQNYDRGRDRDDWERNRGDRPRERWFP